MTSVLKTNSKKWWVRYAGIFYLWFRASDVPQGLQSHFKFPSRAQRTPSTLLGTGTKGDVFPKMHSIKHKQLYSTSTYDNHLQVTSHMHQYTIWFLLQHKSSSINTHPKLLAVTIKKFYGVIYSSTLSSKGSCTLWILGGEECFRQGQKNSILLKEPWDPVSSITRIFK